MKLTTAWVDQTQSQFDVQVIPDNHPAAGKLHEAFGDHTFFLGSEGLHIVEQLEEPDMDPPGREVVKLARWGNDEHTSLEIQEPETVGVVMPSRPDGNGRA